MKKIILVVVALFAFTFSSMVRAEDVKEGRYIVVRAEIEHYLNMLYFEVRCEECGSMYVEGIAIPEMYDDLLRSFFQVKDLSDIEGKVFSSTDPFDEIHGAGIAFRSIIANQRQGGQYTSPTEGDIVSETALQLSSLQCPVFDSYYPEDPWRVFLGSLLALHEDGSKWWFDEDEHKSAMDKLTAKLEYVSEGRVGLKEITEKEAVDRHLALRCPAKYFVVKRKATGEELEVAICKTDFVCKYPNSL